MSPPNDMLKLYIEPSSRCNLECTMCFRNSWVNETFGDLDMKTFYNAIDTMPTSVQTIFFGGMGEPFIHKDIMQMLMFAKSKGVKVEILTNGTLLTREISEFLLDIGLSKLWISIDSLDDLGYENIRQNSNFQLIRKNIVDFNDLRYSNVRPNRKSTELGIAFVAMKSNVHQLGKLNTFAYNNSIQDISISNVSPTDAFSLSEALYPRIINMGIGLGNQGFTRIRLPQMDYRIAPVLEGITSLLKTDFDYIPVGVELNALRGRSCKFINEGTVFVRHDGNVTPCMGLLHSGITYLDYTKRTVHHHSFGNVEYENLKDIWEKDEFVMFRKRVKEFDFSPCTRCGGCERRMENIEDCFGNKKPTCGACLWGEGILNCP